MTVSGKPDTRNPNEYTHAKFEVSECGVKKLTFAILLGILLLSGCVSNTGRCQYEKQAANPRVDIILNEIVVIQGRIQRPVATVKNTGVEAINPLVMDFELYRNNSKIAEEVDVLFVSGVCRPSLKPGNSIKGSFYTNIWGENPAPGNYTFRIFARQGSSASNLAVAESNFTIESTIPIHPELNDLVPVNQTIKTENNTGTRVTNLSVEKNSSIPAVQNAVTDKNAPNISVCSRTQNVDCSQKSNKDSFCLIFRQKDVDDFMLGVALGSGKDKNWTKQIITWYPSLDEGFIESYPIYIRNLGCTKIDLKNLFVRAETRTSEGVIASNTNRFRATLSLDGDSATKDDLLYPNTGVYGAASIGKGYMSRLKISNPGPFTINISLIYENYSVGTIQVMLPAATNYT